MTVLVEVVVDDVAGGVEQGEDVAGGLTLAASQPGKAAAKALRSLAESLEQLEPVLRTVKDKLAASAPEHFTVEFGVKLRVRRGSSWRRGRRR
jgi:hypothetical protein